MRPEVQRLVALGPMPDEDAEPEAIDRWADGLKAIPPPISDAEAALLARCFPPDMGYGVGHRLLHLLETAPGWNIALAETINDEEWRASALSAIRNANRGGSTKDSAHEA